MLNITKIEVTRRVKRVIGKETGRPWTDFLRSNDLIKDLGFSAASKLNLKGPLNAAFTDQNVALTKDDVSDASTVGDLSDLFWEKILEANP